jgi:beta-lactamase regulating signal transducer with metallopeptidase domain
METLRYVVLANALLAVVSIAYYTLLRRETFFGANRMALWLGLAGALLLPILELPDWRPERVRNVMHKTAQVIVPKVLPQLTPTQPEVTITFPNQKTYRLFRHKPAEFVWSWPVGLALLYLIGVVVLLVRFGVQLISLRRLIWQSVHEPYDDFTLVRNQSVTSPFSFFNWVVLNPEQHAPDELDQILRHERVHVRERHSFDMLGAELVCIVFWFNPAVYLFRQLLHQTLEFSADRAVLAEGVDARSYQYNLVKVSMATGQSAITNPQLFVQP